MNIDVELQQRICFVCGDDLEGDPFHAEIVDASEPGWRRHDDCSEDACPCCGQSVVRPIRRQPGACCDDCIAL